MSPGYAVAEKEKIVAETDSSEKWCVYIFSVPIPHTFSFYPVANP